MSSITLFPIKLCLLIISAKGIYCQTNGSQTPSPVVDRQKPIVGYEHGLVSTLEKSMVPFFEVTTKFLGALRNEEFSSESIGKLNCKDFEDTSNFEEYQDWDYWKEHLSDVSGYVACFIAGALFILVCFFGGIIFCCCRVCCRTCGGGTDRAQPPNARLKRRCCSVCMLLITLILLLAAVLCFISSKLIYDELSDEDSGSIGQLSNSLSQLEDYRDQLMQDIDRDVWNTYRSTENVVNRTISDFPTKVKDDIGKLTNATDLLQQAEQTADDIQTIQTQLAIVVSSLDNLQSGQTQLQNSLIAAKNSLNSSNVQNCAASPSVPCQTALAMAQQLNLNVDFSSLPDVKSQLNVLDGILSADIEGLIKKGVQGFDNISNEIDQQAATYIKTAQDALGELSKTVDNTRTDVDEAVNSVNFSDASEALRDAARSTHDNSKYVNYGMLGVSSFLLLIVVLYLMGIVWGTCGEPNYENAACFNKGVGANLLLGGVGLTFLFGWLLMILVIVLFGSAGILYSELCPDLEDPVNSALMQKGSSCLSDYLSSDAVLNRTVQVNFGDALLNCKGNQALFSALQLDQFFNVTDYFNRSSLQAQVDELTDNINPGIIPNVTILNEAARQELNNLAAATINKSDWDSYSDQIRRGLQGLTTVNLAEAASNLTRLANSIGDAAAEADVRAAANELDQSATQLIPVLFANLTDLDAAVSILLPRVNFTATVNSMVAKINSTQDTLNAGLGSLLTQSIQTVADEILDEADRFMSGVQGSFESSIGRCEPVANVYTDVVAAGCHTILYPVNMFWFAMGGFLFFSIFAIFLSAYLSWIYRKDEPYIKYRAGSFERPHSELNDDIPLDHVDRRNKNKRRGQDNGRQNVGYEEDVPHHRSHHHYEPPHERPPSYQPPHNPSYQNGARAGYNDAPTMPSDWHHNSYY